MADDDFEFDISGNIDDLAASIDELAEHMTALGESIQESLNEQTGVVQQQLDVIERSANEWGLSMADIATAAFATWEIGGDILDGLNSALRSLVGEMHNWIDAAVEADQIDAQLAVRLVSTGRSAEFTVKQLSEMADELEKVTTFSDETIRSVELMQLRFKSIKGEEFERVTKAALDMAVAMKTDASTSALILGRALENPGRGMDMLRRQYVTFTPEQRKAIKHFVETNEVVKAQQIILDEVERSVRNSARAAAEASGGGWLQLQNIFENVREELGHELMPVLESAIPGIKFMAEEAAKAVKAMAGTFADAAAEWAGVFATDPAEQFVGVMGNVFVVLGDILERVKDIGAAWRSLKLTNMEIDEFFGGMNPTELGAKHNNQIQIAFLEDQLSGLKGNIAAGTAQQGLNPRTDAQLQEQVVALQDQLNVQLNIKATREKADADRIATLEKLRRDVARDDARINENKDKRTAAEVSKDWIDAFRAHRVELQKDTDWLKLHKDALARVPLPFSGKDQLGLGGDIAASMANVLVPAWATPFIDRVTSVATSTDTTSNKISRLLEDTRGFFETIGITTTGKKDKDEPFQARIENFQSLFSRISTGAASGGRDEPQKQIEKHTRKSAEALTETTKKMNDMVDFQRQTYESVEATRKQQWGNLK